MQLRTYHPPSTHKKKILLSAYTKNNPPTAHCFGCPGGGKDSPARALYPLQRGVGVRPFPPSTLPACVGSALYYIHAFT